MRKKNVNNPANDVPLPVAIVGIGSAAGGLESLEQLFNSLPSDLNLALVIVQHLNTDGSDVICELVRQSSPLPVVELSNQPVAVQCGHVYVAPQRCVVELHPDGLVATETEDAVDRASVIDTLFQSLAGAAEIPVVGVVLSGQGNDGTLGMKAISDAGGMTIAQDPETALHDELPRGAALAGHADHILSPGDIPAALRDYAVGIAKTRKKSDEQAQRELIETVLPRICDVLLEVTDHDFRRYKTNTVTRRVLRRMQVLQLTTAEEYLALIQESRDEAHTLFHDLLISVTAFFRDPDVFVAVENLVIPKLIENVREGQPVRVWVPGCATGEEAYTLAMLLREGLDDAEIAADEIELQIFGTDIDQRALNVARAGTYSASVAKQMSEHRLERFFTQQSKQYVVRKEIRDMCAFSTHNLISDPPYSQMDLISCRNLLIYLGQPLQLKLIPLFHFALRPGGYLLLGPSESLTPHTEIFRTIDERHRISQRKPGPAASSGVFSSSGKLRDMATNGIATAPSDTDMHQISQRIVLDEFSPRYAVIDEDAHIVCSSTGLEKYFEFPDGPFHNNVLKMVKPGLRSGLRAALQQSRETLRTVTRSNLTLKTQDDVQRVELVVQPMPEIGAQEKLFMLVFRDIGMLYERSHDENSNENNSESNDGVDFNLVVDAESTIVQLERELDQTRTDLENAIQNLEGTNEELKSSNEELLSMNEELLSANEELKTSKEEVQTGMEALSRARSDLQNLLDGTKIATIFLDEQGTIKSFTPSAAEVYNIKSGDVGRPLSDITHLAMEMPKLPNATAVQTADAPIVDELQVADGRWFERRVLRYRSEAHPAGVILTFVDASQQKRTATRLAVAHDVTVLLADADSFEEVAPAILEAVRSNLDVEFCALWLIDSKNNTLHCAEIAYADEAEEIEAFVERSRSVRLKPGDGLAGHVWETRKPHWVSHVSDIQGFLRQQSADDCRFMSGAAIPIIAGKRFRGVIEFYSTRPLSQERSLLDMLGGVGHEIGQFIRRKRLDDLFLDEEVRKTAILEAALDCIITMDIDGNIVDFNAAAEATFGINRQAAVGQSLAELIIPVEYRDAHTLGMKRFLETGKSTILGQRLELSALRVDGSEFPVELAINVSSRRDGMPFFTAYLRDITEQKRWELELADREAHLRRVIDNMIGFVGVLDPTGTLLEANQTALNSGGVSRADVIGKKFWDCSWWNFDSATMNQLRESVAHAAQGETIRYDTTVRMAGDTRIVIDFMLVPVVDDEGKVIYLIPSGMDIQDRKLAERKLADAKLRLDLAMKVSQIAAWNWDMQSNELVADENLNRLFGFKPDEKPTTDDFLARIDVVDRARVTTALDRTIQRGDPLDEEYQVHRPSGKTRWLHGQGRARIAIDGTVEDAHGVIVDITDHKLLELELTNREAHLRRVINNQLGLVGVIGKDGLLLEVDDRSLAIGHLTRDEAIGKHFAELPWWTYDDEVSQRIRDAMDRALAGEVVRFDVPLYAADASGLMIDFMIAPVHGDGGQVEYLIPSGVDITERKGLERRLSMALSSGGMAAWEWTPERSIWTDALYELLGLPAEVPPSPEAFYERVHEDDLPGLKDAWAKATVGEEPYDHEFRIRRPDGSVRWLAGVGEVEQATDGEVARIYGMNWDVTKEHEILASLQESEHQAHQANVAKSEFIANMSHEIRTPMTAVLGYTDLLADEEQNEEKAAHLATIKRNGEFLLELINDILDLSKIEAGKLEMSPEKFSLQRVVADVRSTMDVRAREKQLDFQIEFDGEIPEFIESDSKRLRQILVNLIGNALKFTKQGSVRVVVRYLPEAPEATVQFDVIDTGIGMTDDQQERLFQAFSQADASVSREFGGTGLGLAISQRLAKLLGGEITVESELDQGSTFSCTISAGNIEHVKLIRPKLDLQESPATPQSNGQPLNCRVLVVDDRRDVRFLTQRILADAGAEVSAAEDGLEAIELVNEAQANGGAWDIILLDMQMPRLDGYQTAARLREMKFDAPIIALTADAMHGDMDLCLRSGCNAYLSKPIDAQQLVDVVAQYTAGANDADPKC